MSDPEKKEGDHGVHHRHHRLCFTQFSVSGAVPEDVRPLCCSCPGYTIEPLAHMPTQALVCMPEGVPTQRRDKITSPFLGSLQGPYMVEEITGCQRRCSPGSQGLQGDHNNRCLPIKLGRGLGGQVCPGLLGSCIAGVACNPPQDGTRTPTV